MPIQFVKSSFVVVSVFVAYQVLLELYLRSEVVIIQQPTR